MRPLTTANPFPRAQEFEAKRKARAKRMAETVDEAARPAVDGTSYNIWYHKAVGARGYESDDRPPRTWEKVLATIVRTRGNEVPNSPICLLWARGKCTRGADCSKLHRTPTDDDCRLVATTKDVFGRNKFESERDDKSGVGSFLKNTRTLYLGRLVMHEYKNRDPEARLREVFSLWGPVTSIRVIEPKAIAFVEFANRAYAEFAKEVMINQNPSLDPKATEPMNVRWAEETEFIRANRQKRELEQLKKVVNEVEQEAKDAYDQDWQQKQASSAAARQIKAAEEDKVVQTAAHKFTAAAGYAPETSDAPAAAARAAAAAGDNDDAEAAQPAAKRARTDAPPPAAAPDLGLAAYADSDEDESE